MSWFDTPLPSTIKAPTLPTNEWENNAIDPSWIQEAEEDYWFSGGANALSMLADTAEALHADMMLAPQAFMEGLKTGGLYLSAEGAALRWLMLESADTSGPKSVSPEQAKEEFGIDMDTPISLREAYARQLLKQDYDSQLEKWSETALQIERPVTTLSTWAGTAAALWALPSTRVFGGLIRKSLVAGGAAITNAAMMQAAAKFGGQVKDLSKAQKIMAAMHKPMNMFDKWANRLNPAVKNVAATTAIEGTANALEAISAYQIEKSLGNKYDVTGELALGYAAPAVLGAAVRAAKGVSKTADSLGEYDALGKAMDERLFEKARGFRSGQVSRGDARFFHTHRVRGGKTGTTSGRDPRTTEFDFTPAGEFQPKGLVRWDEIPLSQKQQLRSTWNTRTQLTGTEKAQLSFTEALLDSPPPSPKLLQSSMRKLIREQIGKENMGDAEIYAAFRDDPATQLELDKLDAIAALEDMYGPAVLDMLQDVNANMNKAGVDIDIEDAFKWLQSREEVVNRATEVGLDKPAQELFTKTADETETLLKTAQDSKKDMGKAVKEPQPVIEKSDPVKKLQEATAEASAAERVKLTTDSPLQETGTHITFKTPEAPTPAARVQPLEETDPLVAVNAKVQKGVDKYAEGPVILDKVEDGTLNLTGTGYRGGHTTMERIKGKWEVEASRDTQTGRTGETKPIVKRYKTFKGALAAFNRYTGNKIDIKEADLLAPKPKPAPKPEPKKKATQKGVLEVKDPKTGKILKFDKSKITKIDKAGRKTLDDSVQATGGLETGPVQKAEFGEERGAGRGKMVLMRHADGDGEAFQLPESFVKRLELYEKEFPDFPKLQKVEKVPFQEGLADINTKMDSAFKEFKKCVGKGGA